MHVELEDMPGCTKPGPQNRGDEKSKFGIEQDAAGNMSTTSRKAGVLAACPYGRHRVGQAAGDPYKTVVHWAFVFMPPMLDQAVQ